MNRSTTSSVTFIDYDPEEQREIESLKNKLRIVDGAISIVKGQNKKNIISTQSQQLKPIIKNKILDVHGNEIINNDIISKEKEHVTLGRKLLADMDQSYKIDTTSLQRVSCQLCGIEIDMTRIKSHEINECKERKIICPEVGCGSVFPASLLKRHLAKECVTAIQRRKMAASAAIRKQRQEEVVIPPPPPPLPQTESPRPSSVETDTVISLPVLCQDCKESMKSSMLPWHLKNSCKMRKIYCPNRMFGCIAEIPFSLILQHVRSECEAEAYKDSLIKKAKQRQEPVHCPACNELVPLDKLRKHEEQECSNRRVPCRNWCLGCTVQVRLRERKLHEEVDGAKSIRTALYLTGMGANVGINETDIITPWTIEFWILRPNAEESAKSFIRNITVFASHYCEKFQEEVKIKNECVSVLSKLKDSTEITVEERQHLINELGIITMRYEDATIETLGKAEVLQIAITGALNAIGELRLKTMDKIVSIDDIVPGEKEMRAEQQYEKERKEMAMKGKPVIGDKTRPDSKSDSRPITKLSSRPGTVENDNDNDNFDSNNNSEQNTNNNEGDNNNNEEYNNNNQIESYNGVKNKNLNDEENNQDNNNDSNDNNGNNDNSNNNDELTNNVETPQQDDNGNFEQNEQNEEALTDALSSKVTSRSNTRPSTSSQSKATSKPNTRPPTSSQQQDPTINIGNSDILEEGVNDENAGDDDANVEEHKEEEDVFAHLFWGSYDGRIEEMLEMARKCLAHNVDISIEGLANRVYSIFENEAKMMKNDKVIVDFEGLAQGTFNVLYALLARQNKLFKKSAATLSNTTMTWQQWKDMILVIQQLLQKDLEALQSWRIELGLIQSDEVKQEKQTDAQLSEEELALKKKKEKEQKRRDRKKKKALDAKKAEDGEELNPDEDESKKTAKLLPRIEEKIKSVQGAEILASSTVSSSIGGRCKICLNINGKVGIVSTEGAVGSEFASFAASVPRDKWTHVAITCTKKPKNRITLYINGELVGQIKDLAFPLPMGMIGAAPNENSFLGAILDVRYWRKVRSAQEVKLGCRRLVDVSAGRHRLVDTIDESPTKKPRRRPPKNKKDANVKGILKGGVDLTSHGLMAWWTFEDGAEMKNCLSDITEFRFKTPIVASPLSSKKDAATIGGCPGAGHMWLYADFIPVFVGDNIVPIVNLDDEGGSLLPVPSFNAHLKCPFELRRFRLSQSGRALQREVECSLGCGERMRKMDLRNHMRYECIKRTMCCRFDGCQATFLIEDQAQHEKMYCSYITRIKKVAEIAAINVTKIPCMLCSEMVKQRDMSRHQSLECPHRIIFCPHADCRKEIQAHLLEEHLNYSCESYQIKKRLWLIERARERSNYARPWGFSIAVTPSSRSFNGSKLGNEESDEAIDLDNDDDDDDDSDTPLTFLRASLSKKYFRDVNTTDNENDTANDEDSCVEFDTHETI